MSENQFHPFCQNKQALDKNEQSGVATKVPKSKPVKGQSLFYDPWDVEMQIIEEHFQKQQIVKQLKYDEEAYHARVEEIPIVPYYPTTHLKQIREGKELDLEELRSIPMVIDRDDASFASSKYNTSKSSTSTSSSSSSSTGAKHKKKHSNKKKKNKHGDEYVDQYRSLTSIPTAGSVFEPLHEVENEDDEAEEDELEQSQSLGNTAGTGTGTAGSFDDAFLSTMSDSRPATHSETIQSNNDWNPSSTLPTPNMTVPSPHGISSSASNTATATTTASMSSSFRATTAERESWQLDIPLNQANYYAKLEQEYPYWAELEEIYQYSLDQAKAGNRDILYELNIEQYLTEEELSRARRSSMLYDNSAAVNSSQAPRTQEPTIAEGDEAADFDDFPREAVTA